MSDLYRDIFFRNIEGDFTQTKRNPKTEHWTCYIALSYANDAKLDEAEKALTHIPDETHCCPIVLETKALIAYYSGNNKDAQKIALEVLEINKESVFAYAILAGIALKEKKKTKAVEHYKKILLVYPEHDGILLNLADILHEKTETMHIAQEYINRASPSTRRFLSLLLLFIFSMRGRFLWLIPVILVLIIPNVGLWFYIISTILILLGAAWSARKGYMLISTRLLTMQFAHSFFGAIILFFKWLIRITS